MKYDLFSLSQLIQVILEFKKNALIHDILFLQNF